MTDTSPSVLYSVAALMTKLGGPVRSVPFLAEAVARAGYRCSLVSQTPLVSAGCENLMPDQALVPTLLAQGFESARFKSVFAPMHRRTVFRAHSRFRPNLVHDNGLWLPANHNVAVVAAKLGVPRVVSPRGALDDWSLTQRGWLKRAALQFFQLHDLQTAAAFMVTAPEEAESVRKAGLRQPIAVVANGVPIPALASLGVIDAGNGSGRRKALFLSRIHPKKGVATLVEAWQSLEPAGWELVIAGPGDPGYIAGLKQLIRPSQRGGEITFLPEVSEDQKPELYRSANLFLLPSHQENFGIVVAEAMSYGVPVITTTATPWRVLNSSGAGWCIPVERDDLIETLRFALSLPPDDLRARGQVGRKIIESEFSWETAAAKAISFYGWLLRPNFFDRPEHVI